MLKIHDFFSRNRRKKKVVRNFLTNLNFFIFFEFFSENVLKTLLRGRETTRKKYRIFFEKFEKFLKKIAKKNETSNLAKFFEKKKNPIFFF